jgi:hypothetical protein
MWADTAKVSYDLVSCNGCQALERLGCEQVEMHMRFACHRSWEEYLKQWPDVVCDVVLLGTASFEKHHRYQKLSTCFLIGKCMIVEATAVGCPKAVLG